jgi:hypothetical protein
VISFYRSGGFVGSNKAFGTAPGTSLISRSYGGETDLWGLSWTVAQANSSDLGVGVVYDVDGASR